MKIRVVMWVSCWAAMLTALGCVTPIEHNLPPAERLMHPGPGVDGPGPGVMIPPASPLGAGMCMMPPVAQQNVQILFAEPEGMQVRWDVASEGGFDSTPLVVPGRQNFPQAAIYRLKLTNIVGREGVELYPTLEIGPTTPRTEAYLAHNAIPVQFTEEDFDQVLTGNFVTKVIYLPDPEFQELALAGVETLVSTRLDPGVDPITEADRRRAILAVVRLGNKDVELPGANGAASPSIPVRQPDGTVMPTSYTTPRPLLRAADGRRDAGYRRDAGLSGGDGADRPDAAKRGWNHGAGVGHALLRDADRTARPAAYSDGRSGRAAAAYDEEPHAGSNPGTEQARHHQRSSDAGLHLSASAESGPHYRAVDLPVAALRSTAHHAA